MGIEIAYEIARARQALRRAELDLKDAEELVDSDCAVCAKIALQDRVGLARKRAAAARLALRRLHSAGAGGARSA
jgi:hypothetical protein